MRIGRELHDGIGQDILALTLALKTDETNKEIVQHLQEINTEVRSIAHQLVPYSLEAKGLVEAVKETGIKILHPSNIEFYCDIEDLPHLNKEIEISIYRIVQELLQNIIKHAQASQVTLILNARSNTVNLIIEDNGVGMAKNNSGIGLANINSRLEILGGTLKYESVKNEGIIAIVHLPLKKHNVKA
jgi:signal transduction histidine kinase